MTILLIALAGLVLIAFFSVVIVAMVESVGAMWTVAIWITTAVVTTSVIYLAWAVAK